MADTGFFRWDKANGTIALEEHFSRCDVQAGSSSSGFDLDKSSLVICDKNQGPISSSALCCHTPHCCYKQYHKHMVAISKRAPSILLRVPHQATLPPESLLSEKHQHPSRLPNKKPGHYSSLTSPSPKSSRIQPVPKFCRFYHHLHFSQMYSHLAIPFESSNSHSPPPGLFRWSPT